MYKILPILLFAYGLAITTDDIYDNSWALIIGIDKYQNVQNLNYAVKDAESIQDILVNSFNFPEGNITLLKNEEANKDAILKAFSDLTIKAEYNDRVLIYFAGHGETMDLTEGGERGYLLPVDGDRKNLYLSSIGMDELEKISEMSKAEHMLYLVDACYGGIAAVGSRGLPDSTTPDFIEKITRNRAVQIITAGGRGEQVIEKSKWGHSAFTLNLMRGLGDGNADMNADSYITANELGMFLREKVTIESENQQTPQYGRMTSQEGEFVFVYAENAAVIQDKSADAKLDYLISEIEELKSQKSNSDDIIVEKDVDEKQSRTIKIQKTQGIGFMAFEDLLQIGYSRALNKNWYYLMSYANIQDKLFKKLINVESSQTITGNNHSIGLVRYYVLTDYQNNDFMWLIIGGVANYLTVSWKDTEQNISGDVNKIFPSLTAGIGLRPFWINKYSIAAGVTLTIATSLLPKSYSETDGIVTLSGWQIKLFPALLLNIDFPLPKYSP